MSTSGITVKLRLHLDALTSSNSISFCCDDWCDMYVCFNVNCPYLYSHFCVYILYNVVAYVLKRLVIFSLYEI